MLDNYMIKFMNTLILYCIIKSSMWLPNRIKYSLSAIIKKWIKIWIKTNRGLCYSLI